ncbi:TPA: hypothetical protein RQK84_004312 [Vibrio vulnificus]|uniref:hypothetical protein n=1 Tax=Vibrio vulnificus TaxID=672 RepID=UPI001A202D23|nr:hypothetical protein [Vibrio vulnificus]MCG6272228.1 hypothetical protein [Vibrio vulnificus]HAS6263411.1 hypothetical protein [Vibrio vulnificus]HAT8493172.1 hypothetical protein [Vibrio vulnificus]HDY7507613.1 hypothetical protein [Vibrio vulnificus]HDY8016192.1 hypothetical protein [Vibrio vulnificus]
MPFSDMMKDKIQVLKSDGTTSPVMNASVQSKGIYLMRSDFLVEPHDLIQRVMSNGGTETFKVIDPGFYEGMGRDIPAHYQMKVQKLGLPEAEKAVQSITYNISGANARVNNNSTDNSTNVVNINSDLQEALSALKSEVERLNISDSEREEAYEVVEAIDAQCQNEKPSKVVVNALVKSLPTAASISSIGSLIVSLLG